MLFQVVSDRGEHVTLRGPDIAPAVAVEILRELEIRRGHELRLAEGAGPGSLQPFELDVAAVDDLEGAEELLAEERRAPRIVGERGERRDRRAHAGEASEVRFQSPHRGDDPWLHAVLLADRAQEVVMLGVHLLSGLERTARQPALEIRREVECELGLRAIALQNLLDWLDLGERRVEHFGADAAGQGLGPQLGEPRVELLGGCRRKILRPCRASPRKEHHRHNRGRAQHLSTFYRPFRLVSPEMVRICGKL